MMCLPREVISQSLTYLPKHELAMVALTCRILLEDAERELYRTINLSRHQHDVASYFDSRAEEYTTLHAILTSITARGPRGQYVRSLKGQLTAHNYPLFIQLIKLTRLNLTHLDLQHSPPHILFDRELEAGNVLVPFRQLILSSSSTSISSSSQSLFPSLIHLTVPLDHTWQQVTLTFLKTCPTIQHLHITPLQLSHTPPHGLEHVHDITLPSLVSLRIDMMVEEYLPLWTHLLGQCRISEVRLASAFGLRRRSWWKEVEAGLRDTVGLRKLDVQTMLPIPLCGLDTLQEIVLRVEYDGCYAKTLEEIDIPPLPDLRKITFYPDRSRSPSSLSYRANTVMSCNKPHHPGNTDMTLPEVVMSDGLAGRLASTPRLTTIEFNSHLTNEFGSPELDLEDSPRSIQETITVRHCMTAHGEQSVQATSTGHVAVIDGRAFHLSQSVTQTWHCSSTAAADSKPTSCGSTQTDHIGKAP